MSLGEMGASGVRGSSEAEEVGVRGVVGMVFFCDGGGVLRVEK